MLNHLSCCPTSPMTLCIAAQLLHCANAPLLFWPILAAWPVSQQMHSFCSSQEWLLGRMRKRRGGFWMGTHAATTKQRP